MYQQTEIFGANVKESLTRCEREDLEYNKIIVWHNSYARHSHILEVWNITISRSRDWKDLIGRASEVSGMLLLRDNERNVRLCRCVCVAVIATISLDRF